VAAPALRHDAPVVVDDEAERRDEVRASRTTKRVLHDVRERERPAHRRRLLMLDRSVETDGTQIVRLGGGHGRRRARRNGVDSHARLECASDAEMTAERRDPHVRRDLDDRARSLRRARATRLERGDVHRAKHGVGRQEPACGGLRIEGPRPPLRQRGEWCHRRRNVRRRRSRRRRVATTRNQDRERENSLHDRVRSRVMFFWCASMVPPPISINLASRQNCSTRYSVQYP